MLDKLRKSNKAIMLAWLVVTVAVVKWYLADPEVATNLLLFSGACWSCGFLLFNHIENTIKKDK